MSRSVFWIIRHPLAFWLINVLTAVAALPRVLLGHGLPRGKARLGAEMSQGTDKPWPPMIEARNKPRWLWWRDFAITLATWALFAGMLETEFELFFGHYLDRFGIHLDVRAHWPRFFRPLEPYIWLTIMLLAFLGAATVATVHRVRRSLVTAPPPPLQAVEEASHAGMEVAALLAARELRQAVVHVHADGARRVEPVGNATPIGR